MCGDIVVYPEGLNGEKICGKCGLVIDEIPQIKNYSPWNPEWYSNYNEQDSTTLKEWLTILRAVSCQLNIPNFPYREEAARTIRRKRKYFFQSQKLSKNKRETVAALLHLTLKEYNKIRPIKQISQELSIDHRKLLKQTWLLNKTINEEKETMSIRRKTAIDYLHEYAGKITKANELIIDAENKLEKVKRLGGNPIGLAAGAFYNSCKESKENLSKENIGQAFHISERTVYTNEARIRKQLNAIATTN